VISGPKNPASRTSDAGGRCYGNPPSHGREADFDFPSDKTSPTSMLRFAPGDEIVCRRRIGGVVRLILSEKP